jgi:amidase
MKRIPRHQVVHAMDKEVRPVARVQPGERLLVETEDCFSHQIQEPSDTFGPWFDYSRINPATGPIFVEGALLGDVLEVRVEEIRLPEKGVVASYPGWGPLGDKVKDPMIRIVPLDNGCARFSPEISLPLKPMIGVIGTVPAGGPVPCGSPGPHGGNLDTLEVTEGARIFLPVFVPGALLALGDVHAAMGDGEVCGTAVECRAEVVLQVELHPRLGWTTPHLIRDESHYILTSGKSLKEAVRLATEEAVKLLSQAQGLTWQEAYMLASLVGDLQISQVVNPLKTVRMRIPLALVWNVSP